MWTPWRRNNSDPPIPEYSGTPDGDQPRGLTAAAQRVTSTSLNTSGRRNAGEEWQADAWHMYDLVGELRFLANTLAGRMSQAQLYVGTTGEDVERPDPVTDPILQSLLDNIGRGQGGIANIIYRVGANLFVPGESWIVGIPQELIDQHTGGEHDEIPNRQLTDPNTDVLDVLNDTTVDQLAWRSLSSDEVAFNQARDAVTIHLEETMGGKMQVHPDSVFLIRVWRSHPRRSWEPDSPVRSNLPVLRELVGLTMHISAQVDSRLAGAGIFLVPDEAAKAMRNRLNIPEDSEQDPFADMLYEGMITPIQDRASASAVVPVTATVPEDSIEKFRHLSFASELDKSAKELREEAIRRFALGVDAPPELLLGSGGMSHWGAWLIREDVVTTHLEPPLALICDALTEQYLRPMMLSLGYSQEEAERHSVWYDVSKLIVRPNRASDARELYNQGVLSDETVRTAAGFDETDAPLESQLGDVEQVVFSMIRQSPELAQKPGIDKLREQIDGLLSGTTGDETTGGEGDTPDDSTDDADNVRVRVEQPQSEPGGPPATDESDAANVTAGGGGG